MIFSLPPVSELIILAVLVIIGIIIIALLKVFITLLPAIVVAAVVWFLTGSALYAGIAFLVIVVLGFLRRR